MVKKSIGIATILLLILVIGITIARASTHVSRLQLLDQHGHALTELGDLSAKALLPDLHLNQALETLNHLDLSQSAAVNKVTLLSRLPNSLQQNLALSLQRTGLQALNLST